MGMVSVAISVELTVVGYEVVSNEFFNVVNLSPTIGIVVTIVGREVGVVVKIIALVVGDSVVTSL